MLTEATRIICLNLKLNSKLAKSSWAILLRDVLTSTAQRNHLLFLMLSRHRATTTQQSQVLPLPLATLPFRLRRKNLSPKQKRKLLRQESSSTRACSAKNRDIRALSPHGTRQLTLFLRLLQTTWRQETRFG